MRVRQGKWGHPTSATTEANRYEADLLQPTATTLPFPTFTRGPIMQKVRLGF